MTLASEVVKIGSKLINYVTIKFVIYYRSIEVVILVYHKSDTYKSKVVELRIKNNRSKKFWNQPFFI